MKIITNDWLLIQTKILAREDVLQHYRNANERKYRVKSIIQAKQHEVDMNSVG